MRQTISRSSPRPRLCHAAQIHVSTMSNVIKASLYHRPQPREILVSAAALQTAYRAAVTTAPHAGWDSSHAPIKTAPQRAGYSCHRRPRRAISMIYCPSSLIGVFSIDSGGNYALMSAAAAARSGDMDCAMPWGVTLHTCLTECGSPSPRAWP